MVTSARFDEIKDYFEPLNALPTLILPQAFLLVQHGFEEMNLASMKYPSVFSSLIRTSAREVLEKEPLEDWLLDTHTDRLHLIHKSGIRVRFLKKIKYGNGLPPAGNNIARQSDWLQPPLEGQKDLFGDTLRDLRFVVGWQYHEQTFTCSLFHPISTGTIQQGTKADINIQLGVDDSTYRAAEFKVSEENELLVANANFISMKNMQNQRK